MRLPLARPLADRAIRILLTGAPAGLLGREDEWLAPTGDGQGWADSEEHPLVAHEFPGRIETASGRVMRVATAAPRAMIRLPLSAAERVVLGAR